MPLDATPHPLRRRRLLVGVIVVFWLAMMGMLAKRELGAPRGDHDRGVTPLEEPVESWMGLYAGEDERLGYVHLQHIPERRHDRDGVTTRLVVAMTLHLFGRPTSLDLNGSAWRPYSEAEAEISFQVRSGEHDFRMEGRVADQRLVAEVHSAGEVLPLELPVEDDLFFTSGFGTAFTLPDLEVGEEVRISSFDPLTLSTTPVRVRCVAREVRKVGGREISTRVLRLDTAGLQSRAWIDDDGTVLRAETGLGLTVEAIDPKEALAPVEAGAASSLLNLTAIRPTGPRPFRGAGLMEVAIAHLGESGVPEDGVQTRSGADRYRIAPKGPADPTAEASGGDSTSEPVSSEFLRSDAFVQSDHPRIADQAEAILEEVGEDPWQRARALADWVYDGLEKSAVISIPSALEVLAQRRGDCNEHTVLYAALARSAGLPTRIAIGIVWSDDFGGFYYHAWPEVRIGDSWIWIDPTLGQEVADATHIKLLNGGIESWSQLLPFLGRLEIEVLEVR